MQISQILGVPADPVRLPCVEGRHVGLDVQQGRAVQDVHFLDGQYTVFGKVVAGQKAALALRQGDKIISARLAN